MISGPAWLTAVGYSRKFDINFTFYSCLTCYPPKAEHCLTVQYFGLAQFRLLEWMRYLFFLLKYSYFSIFNFFNSVHIFDEKNVVNFL